MAANKKQKTSDRIIPIQILSTKYIEEKVPEIFVYPGIRLRVPNKYHFRFLFHSAIAINTFPLIMIIYRSISNCKKDQYLIICCYLNFTS